MNIQSLWLKDTKINQKKESPKKLCDTNILIIGGGITGLTCAYFLKDCEQKITLVDKANIGMGVSSKTTAKLNYLQGTIYQDLAQKNNEKQSKLYFDSQIEAIKTITDIIESNHINCNLEKIDSYLYTNDEKNIEKLEKEKYLLKKWGVKVKETSTLPIKNIPIIKGFSVPDTYVFHPIKYLHSLRKIISKKVSICENVMITDLIQQNEKYLIKTNDEIFLADIVIIACHYPFFIKPGIFPLFTHLEREYAHSAKINLQTNFTAINIDSNLQSIRFYKDYLIYVSNKQKLTEDFNYKEAYEKSEKEFINFFGKAPEYSWMNQDLMTNDNLPWIGKLSKNQPNLYIGTGYQAWGMTNGTIAGKIISDLILGLNNPYTLLFTPLRSKSLNILPIFSNSLDYLKAYKETYFNKNKKFYLSKTMILKINGIDYGIYIDENKEKHIVRNLCPHLKCKLIFNESEKTWDCPCHGSRFSIDGDVIEGPANFSIRP